MLLSIFCCCVGGLGPASPRRRTQLAVSLAYWSMVGILGRMFCVRLHFGSETMRKIAVRRAKKPIPRPAATTSRR